MRFLVRNLKDEKAFTIIELIVVIAIVGILILLAFPNFMGYVSKSKITLIKHDIKVIEDKIAEEYIDNEDIFDNWEKTKANLKELISQKKLYEREGLATKIETDDHRIVPIDIIKKGGTKLKGTFYVEKGGKVYYENKKQSNSISNDNCSLIDCGEMLPVKSLNEFEKNMLIDFTNDNQIAELYKYKKDKILFMFSLTDGKINPIDAVGINMTTDEVVYGMEYDQFVNAVPFPKCYIPNKLTFVDSEEKPINVNIDNSMYIKPQALREEMKELIGNKLSNDFKSYTLYEYEGKEYIIGFEFFSKESFGATIYNWTEDYFVADNWYSWWNWVEDIPFPTHYINQNYELYRETCNKNLNLCGLLYDDNLLFKQIEDSNIVKDINGKRWSTDSLVNMHFTLNEKGYSKLNAYDYIKVLYYGYHHSHNIDDYFIGLKNDKSLWKYNPIEGQNRNEKLLLNNVEEFHKVEDGIIALLENGDLYGWGEARYTGLGNAIGYTDIPTKIMSDVDYIELTGTLKDNDSELLIIDKKGETYLIGGFSRITVPYHISKNKKTILGIDSFKFELTPPRLYHLLLDENGRLTAANWLYNYNDSHEFELVSSNVVDYINGILFVSTTSTENNNEFISEWEELTGKRNLEIRNNVKKTFKDKRYVDNEPSSGYFLTNDNKLYDLYNNHIMDNVKNVEIFSNVIAKITTLNNKEYFIDEEYNISDFRIENVAKRIISSKYYVKNILIYNIGNQIFINDGYSIINSIEFTHGKIIDIDLTDSNFGQIIILNDKGELWYFNLEGSNLWQKVGTKNECYIYDFHESVAS